MKSTMWSKSTLLPSSTVRYSGSQLLRKTCLRLGVIFAFLVISDASQNAFLHVGCYCRRLTPMIASDGLGTHRKACNALKLIVV